MTVYQTHAYKHGVGWSNWHFQWVTKYRRRVFEDVALQKLCEIFLHEVAKRHSFAIEELEVALDHVHVVASLRPSMSPSHVVQLTKGYTAQVNLLKLVAEGKVKYKKVGRQNQFWLLRNYDREFR